MLALYPGLFENLSPAQQRAIQKLTVWRYVEDIYHLERHLQQSEGLAPGTPEFERAYNAAVDWHYAFSNPKDMLARMFN